MKTGEPVEEERTCEGILLSSKILLHLFNQTRKQLPNSFTTFFARQRIIGRYQARSVPYLGRPCCSSRDLVSRDLQNLVKFVFNQITKIYINKSLSLNSSTTHTNARTTCRNGRQLSTIERYNPFLSPLDFCSSQKEFLDTPFFSSMPLRWRVIIQTYQNKKRVIY